MVHFYLLVMVLAIWVGYLLKLLLDGFSKKYFVIYGLLTMVILLFNMWNIGYFTIAVSNSEGSGFGYYSMNILAPFNPMGAVLSSHPTVYASLPFLKNINMATGGQYEGFNYLGFGVLVLITVSLFKISRAMKDSNSNNLLPITIVMLLLFIFSLSDKVTFGSEILFEFKYPWILNDLGNILRASGRLF